VPPRATPFFRADDVLAVMLSGFPLSTIDREDERKGCSFQRMSTHYDFRPPKRPER
jgi:hypothetical protein